MAYVYSNRRTNPITGAASPRPIEEIHTISELTTDLPGVYGVQLRDAIIQGTLTVTEAVTGGSTFVEVTTEPLAGQVAVTYTNQINKRGLLLFNPADAGKEVIVEYSGLGSLNTRQNIEAIADEAGEQAAIDWLATYQGPVLPGALYGCEIANDGTTPESKLVVTSGKCMDSTDTIWMICPAWTLDLSTTWSAGDGSGKLVDATGLGTEETYHIFAISDGSGTVDYCVSPNITPTLPSGYTYYRRIGSRQTDSSGDLIVVHQHGDWHEYDEVQVPLDNVQISTSGALYSLGTPAGVSTRAAVIASPGNPAGTGNNALTVSLTGAYAQAQLPALSQRRSGFRGLVGGEHEIGAYAYATSSYALVTTDTAGQIRMRRTGAYLTSDLTTVQVLGYYDRRGKR